jgi:hypothetical protein
MLLGCSYRLYQIAFESANIFAQECLHVDSGLRMEF